MLYLGAVGETPTSNSTRPCRRLARPREADAQALRERAERIESDTEAEVRILRDRYAVWDVRWFPMAAEILVPEGEV